MKNEADQGAHVLDWRLKAASTLAAPYHSDSGKVFPIGTVVMQSSALMHEGKKYSFGVPSAPALFLDLSKRAHVQAQEMVDRPNFFVGLEGQVPSMNPDIFFDFLEQMMASVVFSYTCLESFANQAIPVGYVYRREKNDKKCTEEFTKEQIERNLSQEEKFILSLEWLSEDGVSNPKGTKLWERYKKLAELRDRIIHLKSADLKASDPTNLVPDSIWQELVKIPETYQVAYDMATYFSGKKVPGWLTKFSDIH